MVFAAGEITVSRAGDVLDVSNQSTGFCPEPASWSALVSALDDAGLAHPAEWSMAFEFRRCTRFTTSGATACEARTLVKDDVYECAECGAELPQMWNFDRTRCRRAFIALGRAGRWILDVIEEAASGDQDRVAVCTDGDSLVLALADGAGGSGGGAQAAERAVDVLSSGRVGDPSVLLTSLDVALQPIGGECTAVLARLTGDAVVGASVGDSQLCVRDHRAAWSELTAGQARKPLLGSGRACPTGFQAISIQRLLVATDGLMKYAPWPQLCALLDADEPSLPWDLVDTARLSSGNLQDDLCAVWLRPAEAASRRS
jgi:hypothetical protein